MRRNFACQSGIKDKLRQYPLEVEIEGYEKKDQRKKSSEESPHQWDMSSKEKKISR